MSGLLYLIPIALFLGALGLVAFLWALKSSQFEDLDGAANRILFDDELKGAVQAGSDDRAVHPGDGLQRGGVLSGDDFRDLREGVHLIPGIDALG